MNTPPREVDLPSGYGLALFPTIDSTNAEALRRAQSGSEGPLWILAEEQTQGRGRRGRYWESRTGNMYASLLLMVAGPANKLTELGFVTGLAIYDAVIQSLPANDEHVSIKWPNDLLIGGAKTSGMLMESSNPGGDGRWPLAIGIGINVVEHPEDTPYPATHLREHGSKVHPNMLLQRLAFAFDGWHSVWAEGSGFERILGAWMVRASGKGESVLVNYGDRSLKGTFENIDRSGALMLRLDDGSLERVMAGDLFLAGGHMPGITGRTQ